MLLPQADGTEVNEDESLLEVFVRSNWFAHYQHRFIRFLREDRSPISWNWAAFFVPGWFLYRKLYGWFFAFVALFFIIGMAHVVAGGSTLMLLGTLAFFAVPVLQGLYSVAVVAGGSTLMLLGTLTFFAVPVLQGMYGDYLVYRRGRRVINQVRATVADPDSARRAVSDFGGTSIVALLVLLLPMAVVWMGIFGALFAIPKGPNVEPAYVAAMKSDLRNLISAEEAYFADFSTYATKAGLGATYSESPGVTVTLASVTGTGWQATASHNDTTATCIIYMGANTPAGLNAGEPICD